MMSHGPGIEPERLRSGSMMPVTRPATVVDAGALMVIDGQDGIGQVLTAQATRHAVARAKAHGLVAVNGPYQYNRKSGAEHFMIVLDIEKMQPLPEFNQRWRRSSPN